MKKLNFIGVWKHKYEVDGGCVKITCPDGRLFLLPTSDYYHIIAEYERDKMIKKIKNESIEHIITRVLYQERS